MVEAAATVEASEANAGRVNACLHDKVEDLGGELEAVTALPGHLLSKITNFFQQSVPHLPLKA